MACETQRMYRARLETNMVTCEEFNERLKSILCEWGGRQCSLDKEMDDRVSSIIAEESLRISSTVDSPVEVGERVFCPGYKREGTVVKITVAVDVSNDDYYAARYGPHKLISLTDEWDLPSVSFSYTIQPDPSPKRGRVAPTYESQRLTARSGFDLLVATPRGDFM